MKEHQRLKDPSSNASTFLFLPCYLYPHLRLYQGHMKLYQFKYYSKKKTYTSTVVSV